MACRLPKLYHSNWGNYLRVCCEGLGVGPVLRRGKQFEGAGVVNAVLIMLGRVGVELHFGVLGRLEGVVGFLDRV